MARLKMVEAVSMLDALGGEDPDGDHSRADEILLETVHPDVAAAYKRLVDRARWWACA